MHVVVSVGDLILLGMVAIVVVCFVVAFTCHMLTTAWEEIKNSLRK